uniref:Uncharacterized protein n=1 Tax=Arundo donax TaxID=35708 RepID=A0A0A9C1N6_ARUDO
MSLRVCVQLDLIMVLLLQLHGYNVEFSIP